ncbi:MAG: aspartate ammonia-lyase [Selenomonadaceae bacterium]|uniref:aspartate ammonia-lyase n=1 Tax=Anaerovibrio slackiae TaxID=2652309 RepID=UPI003869609E|nr:aspartate ammonia-lyase [Selenomonadaceae bacterium]MBQ5650901.1 aspartate ammonia-lyase [Selenomonadaceae bacterium]MBQ5732595.1 aspartate ammonia-lyase [Selenomonadaceae bacterium]MBQ5822655.1 aspartate ammonia-lyase [Selenomonadaceae bacterium]MBQ5846534.1 aspartate ammonia-lyase [Selenomonadaceae bacterium]
MRKEHDFLGELSVPDEVYYGVQTIRAVENFKITGQRVDTDFIIAMAQVKKAAILANMSTGRLEKSIGEPLQQAAEEIIGGRFLDQFPVDPIQGGAGTSFNMNMNEVLCNRALEITGQAKGRYDIISPNNHGNMAQSTNDTFPTAIKVCLRQKGKKLLAALDYLATELENKSEEYKDILKMARTHLQDAVPITLGQEMGSYASSVRRGMRRISHALDEIRYINMGGTAVGTGLNAEPAYLAVIADKLSEVTGEQWEEAANLIDATNNTDGFADVSAAMKNTALVLIKMANDFRLMASGPRDGFYELKLPMRQPGSSIMPGKVNPVIAEVLNQTCYQVVGNDLAVSLAVENGQFELNVMEPVMAFNMFNSMKFLTNAVNGFVDKLLKDLEPNRQQCQHWLDRSVGVVTALLPHIGYEQSAQLAKEAYSSGRPIREIILEKGIMSEERLNEVMSPMAMTSPGIVGQ